MWGGIVVLTIYSVAVAIVPSLGRVGMGKAMGSIGKSVLNKNQERQQQAEENRERFEERRVIVEAAREGNLLKRLDLENKREVVTEQREVQLIKDGARVESQIISILNDIIIKVEALDLQRKIINYKGSQVQNQGLSIPMMKGLKRELYSIVKVVHTNLKNLQNDLDVLRGYLYNEEAIFSELRNFDETHRRLVVQQITDAKRLFSEMKNLHSQLQHQPIKLDPTVEGYMRTLEQEEAFFQNLETSLMGEDKAIFRLIERDIVSVKNDKVVLAQLNLLLKPLFEMVESWNYNPDSSGVVAALFNLKNQTDMDIDNFEKNLRDRRANLENIWRMLGQIHQAENKMQQLDHSMEQIINQVKQLENQKLSFNQQHGFKKFK